MLYILPDYYPEFHCTAESCEDTCCAGWQIVIDRQSLKRYRAYRGPFRRRLLRSVNWKKEIFRQDGEKRCAFLNDKNLCDLYTHVGADSLCRTCRLYPRHIEEYENVREISLSVSCPEANRLLLTRKAPVRFLEFEREREETYEEFDALLYSELLDCRAVMLELLQNRKLPLKIRCGLVTGLANDMQKRFREGTLFSFQELLGRVQEDVRLWTQAEDKETKQNRAETARGGQAGQPVERYEKEPEAGQPGESDKKETKAGQPVERYRKKPEAERSMERYRKEPETEQPWKNYGKAAGKSSPVWTTERKMTAAQEKNFGWVRDLFCELHSFECLKEDWPLWLAETEDWLYGKGEKAYRQTEQEFLAWMKADAQDWELPFEQLLVYFTFVYFCGAVYDGEILASAQLGVVHVWLIREMMMAVWLRNGKAISLEDMMELVCRYSRELEHSDVNQKKMEEELRHRRLPWL